MKLLAPLAEGELERLYHELARIGARTEGRKAPWPYGKLSAEELVVLAAQASRHDPRLLWVITELLARHYDRLDPLRLRRALEDARWPATLGVAFAFARRAAPGIELADVADFVMRRTPRARGERYFLGGRAFAGTQARRDAEESLDEYLRWGFLSREEPISKELSSVHGTLGPEARLNLLRRLVERMGTIGVGDYVAALRGRASARQARSDLARAPFLRREGRTRGARYRLRSRRD